MRYGILFFVLLPGAVAQTEQVGPVRGDNVSSYNIVNSFETGYRFQTVGGDQTEYRSQENYGNGLRLLGSSLTVNSRDGHGRYFDEIALTTQGLGNDPYESASLRVQKNGLYRYDKLWRLDDYVNPGLVSGGAGGLHGLDTRYLSQDHDLTLFPQSKIKFFLGYTRGAQSGPAISTLESPDESGDVFPVFANVRRVRNEYRIGNELQVFGIKFTWTRGWENFKEDTPFNLLAPELVGGAALNTFQRSDPTHGSSPYWRAGLFAERSYFSLNGRFTYTAGRNAFVTDETAIGSLPSAGFNRQVLTSGTAERPVTTGNLTLSLFPISRLTITNSTAVYNVRTEGASTYSEFDNASLNFQFLAFQYLGIRTFSNDTTANLQANNWLSVTGGYHYSDRRIRSVVDPSIPTYDQTNHLKAGTFGIRLRPYKPLTLVLDGEVGSGDRPFAPAAERNYHALGARTEYKRKNFLLSAYARTNYNNNSITLTAYSSRSRTYSASASWTPVGWFALDAGYSKLHLDTVGGIAYFAGAQLIQGGQSIYLSNIHAVNLGARMTVKRRAEVYVGFSRVQDAGGGATPAPAAFQAAQTFPLTFESPLGRVSVRLHERLRWNAGYQYYGYHQELFAGQNYRAHTGYTSLLYSF